MCNNRKYLTIILVVQILCIVVWYHDIIDTIMQSSITLQLRSLSAENVIVYEKRQFLWSIQISFYRRYLSCKLFLKWNSSTLNYNFQLANILLIRMCKVKTKCTARKWKIMKNRRSDPLSTVTKLMKRFSVEFEPHIQ